MTQSVNVPITDSLNVPLPPAVTALVDESSVDLPEKVRQRTRHTLVLKRLPEADTDSLRSVLTEAPAFEARITGLDSFDAETGPVVYLAVESPGLVELHQRLCDIAAPIAGIEGDDYVPHITLGRGGNSEAVQRFLDRTVEPVTWRVDELVGWNGTYREHVGRFPIGR